MKKILFVLMAATVLAIPAMAQGPGNPPDANAAATINVQANVVSIFEFEVTDPGLATNVTLNFGDVDTSGSVDPASNMTLTATPNFTTGEAVYTADTVKEWAVRTAPLREVAIEFTSNNATGGMTASQLKLRIPTGTLNATVPALSFSTPVTGGFLAAAPGANLLTGLPAGRAALERTGTIDIELTVQPDDVAGAQTFDLVVTAYGT